MISGFFMCCFPFFFWGGGGGCLKRSDCGPFRGNMTLMWPFRFGRDKSTDITFTKAVPITKRENYDVLANSAELGGGVIVGKHRVQKER